LELLFEILYIVNGLTILETKELNTY